MQYWDILLRFFLAIVAGGIIGYERETRRHPAGLRTHILVCVGAAMVAVIECILAERIANAGSGVSLTLGRMSAQVISGVGFLGAGTIMTTKRNIAGLTTAASLWAVACIGIAAGMGMYGLCLIGAGFTLIVLTVIKRLVIGHFYKVLEVSFRHRKETMEFLNDLFTVNRIRVLNVDFRTKEAADGTNLYTNLYTLDLPHKLDSSTIIVDIAEHQNVLTVRTQDPN